MSLMTWPVSVPYGAINIKILFEHPDDMEESIGQYSIYKGHATCRIDNTLQNGLRDQTVLHELVHAWIRLAGIKLEEDVEESLADAIGQGVAQMMEAT